MTYNIGDQFEFSTIEIRVDNNGKEYIAVYDNEAATERRIYNILKCQREDGLPKTIFAVVTQVDSFGRVKFKQDESRLFKEHYQEGKYYIFHVNEVKEDYNSKVLFYAIEDDFAEHKYYFKGEQKHQVGDDCILEVSGFTSKGFLQFKEHDTLLQGEELSNAFEKSTGEKESDFSMNNEPILAVGDEDMWTEFKTTIAFPPGNNGEADIDKQLYNIMKELTGFMNAEGGTLYIGVHDKSKRVVGIERDFAHLNEGEDEYNGSYDATTDSYQLKIRNAVNRYCTGVANSLMNFEFPKEEGVQYCKIIVKKSKRPVWLNDYQLIVRQGNRTRRLKGDEITLFVSELMTISIQNQIEVDSTVPVSPLDMDQLKEAIVSILNETQAPSIPLPPPPSLDEVDYWIVWYNDGRWVRQRTESSDADVYIQVPVHKNLSDPSVVFCYKLGKVNVVKLNVFRKGANMNVKQDKGWSKTGEKPMSIFITLQTDFIVGYSIDHNGIESVKLHALTDYAPTQSAANLGAPFVPNGVQMNAFRIIGAEHKGKVAHLICAKGKRSVEVGVPLNSVPYREEINCLESILKES